MSYKQLASLSHPIINYESLTMSSQTSQSGVTSYKKLIGIKDSLSLQTIT